MGEREFLELVVVGIVALFLWVARSVRRGNVVMFLALVGFVEAHLWLNGLEGNVPARQFQVFIAALLALVAFHHHKLPAIALGCGVMAALFIADHGWRQLVDHFFGHDAHAEERRHIIGNLAVLLPGFAMIAYYFEHSGACAWIERRVQSDVGILWMVYGLSIGLDNIAAAMIGGSLVMARYRSVITHCRTRRRNLPRWLFMLLIGVIAASNLGGAASFVGDTTTVMIYLSGVGALELAKGFTSSALAQRLLGWLMVQGHKEMPEDYDHTHAGRQEYVDWRWQDVIDGLIAALLLVCLPWRWGRLCGLVLDGRRLYPLFGIPGLVVGNILVDEPGIGLWIGLLAGITLAKVADLCLGTGGTPFSWKELWHAVPNTAFLLLLVTAAKLLPLDELKPVLLLLGKEGIAILLGLLSPVFDNIPLTSLALDIGGFDWALLALAVGYGGSMLWFGSSAGVALARQFPELENTRHWFAKPFMILFAVYWIMIAAHLLVWRWIPALWG